MNTRFLLRGDLACFSRPESPDRFTYPICTPSALRGVISAVYGHPGIYADVRRIHVLNPIRYVRLGHTHTGNVTSFGKRDGILRAPGALKRTTVETSLRDPAWLVEFMWRRMPGSQHPFDPSKIKAIFMRRVERGEFYYTPTLGLHEYRAIVAPVTGDERPIAQSRDFGMVLHDIDYRGPHAVPHVFHARMVDGAINVPSFYDTVLNPKRRRAA